MDGNKNSQHQPAKSFLDKTGSFAKQSEKIKGHMRIQTCTDVLTSKHVKTVCSSQDM